MKAITASWFETKIRYDKMMDDGLLKAVTETYVFDSLTFTEAESNTIEELSSYVSGEFKVVAIKPASYKEVFFPEDSTDDKWYKAKLQFITIDEKTSKEKKQNIYYLIQAKSLEKAVGYIGEVMGKTMVDYRIASVAETAVLDVYIHETTSSEE